MAFWGGERLFTEGVQKKIVDPFDPNKADSIDCSAFTLTMGAEAYVTPSYGDDPRTSVKQQLREPRIFTMAGQSARSSGGTVVIPPGQFAFLLTEEIVSIPKDTMGFISLKSKPKFGGLINVSGFHVDPGFRGKLIFSVFNAGPSSILVNRGDSLFLLWIADLSGQAKSPYFKQGLGYSEIPSDFISKVATENHSLRSLSKTVEELKIEVDFFKRVATTVGVILGLVAAWISVKPVLSPETPVNSSPAQAAISTSTPSTSGNLASQTKKVRDQASKPAGGAQSTNSAP
jgi:dCTP deaminase